MPVFSYPAEPAPSLLYQHLLLTWNSLLSKSKVSSSSACIIVVILMNDRLIISVNAIQAESVILLLFHFLLDWMLVRYKGPGCGEGGQGGPHIPSLLPCSPSFHLFFLGFLPLALFRWQNIEHRCIVPFPTTSPSSHPFSHPPSFPFLSRLPYQSCPLLSQPVPPLFSPPPWFV